MLATRRIGALLVGAGYVLFGATGGVSLAQNSITYQLGVAGAPVTVTDEDDIDLDPDANELEFLFVGTDPEGIWRASGRFRGYLDADTQPHTILTDFLVEKIAGVIKEFDEFRLEHSFSTYVSGVSTRMAVVGEYDRIGGGNISMADTRFVGFVNDGVPIGEVDPPAAIGVPGPVLFGGVAGPVLTGTIFEHAATIPFYLDEIGDAFRLPLSLEIVPEPGALSLVGLLMVLGAGRRRIRRACPATP